MSDTLKAGPGADLQAAREGMEVSTREVADALNLPVNVIEALEADDYERLPPTVFTRGYLRSYARLLELSPESLLARYPEVTEEIDAITGELPVVSIPTVTPTRALGIAAVVGVILIALLVWLLGDDEQPVPGNEPIVVAGEAEAVAETAAERPVQPADEPQDTVRAPQSEPLAQEVITAAEVPVAQPEDRARPAASAEGPVSAESRTQAPDPGLESGTRQAATERSQQAAVETPIAPASRSDDGSDASPAVAEPEVTGSVTPSSLERRITEFGDDTLTFVFSEDCWVEVKSAEGDNLYSDLNRTGRTLVLTGRAPFRILLGYAPGVSLSFNDESVPLARYTRNNVANLVLGE